MIFGARGKLTGSCIDAVTIEIANDNMLKININFSCLHDANGINLRVGCNALNRSFNNKNSN